MLRGMLAQRAKRAGVHTTPPPFFSFYAGPVLPAISHPDKFTLSRGTTASLSLLERVVGVGVKELVPAAARTIYVIYVSVS